MSKHYVYHIVYVLFQILIQRHLKRGSKRRRKDSIFNRKQSIHQIKRGDAYSESEDDKSKRQHRIYSTSVGRGRICYDAGETDDETPRKKGRASSLRSPRNGHSPRDVGGPYGIRRSEYPDSDDDPKKRQKSKYSTLKYSDESDDNLKKCKSYISNSRYSGECDDDLKKRRTLKFGNYGIRKHDEDSGDERVTRRRMSRFKSDEYSRRVEDSHGHERSPKDSYGHRRQNSNARGYGGRASRASLNNNNNNNKDANSNNNNSKGDYESDEDGYNRRRLRSRSPVAKQNSLSYESGEGSKTQGRGGSNKRKSLLESNGSSAAGGASASRYSIFQPSVVRTRSHSGNRATYWADSEDEDDPDSRRKSLTAGARKGSLEWALKRNKSNYWDSDEESGGDYGRKRSFADKRKSWSGATTASDRKRYDDDSDKESYRRKVGGPRKNLSGEPFGGNDVAINKNYWEESDEEEGEYGRKMSLGGGNRKKTPFRKNYRDDNNSDKNSRKKSLVYRKDSTSPFSRRKSKWHSDEDDKYGRGQKSSLLRKRNSLDRIRYSDDSGDDRRKFGIGKKNTFNRIYSDEEDDVRSTPSLRKRSSFNKTYFDEEDDVRRKPSLRKRSSFNETYSDEEDDGRRKPSLRKRSSFIKNYSDEEDDGRRKPSLSKRSSFNRINSDEEDDDKRKPAFRKKRSFSRKFLDDSHDEKRSGRSSSLRKQSTNGRQKYSDDFDDQKRKKSYARPTTSAKGQRDDSDDDSYRVMGLKRPSSVEGKIAPSSRYRSDSDEGQKGKGKDQYGREFDDSDENKGKGRRGSKRDSKDNDEAEVSILTQSSMITTEL